MIIDLEDIYNLIKVNYFDMIMYLPFSIYNSNL